MQTKNHFLEKSSFIEELFFSLFTTEEV